MANQYKDIDPEELMKLAMSYCDFCIEATKEIATNSGVKKIKERHLPTISYFLLHWLRQNEFEFYKRTNWYNALNDKDHPLLNTIKSIDSMFTGLAVDIVANEGKGIFYAKNKLGMTDKQSTDITTGGDKIQWNEIKTYEKRD
jgi:hypothetical protein